MYLCSLCRYSTGVLQNYVGHYRAHRHLHNFRFPCGIDRCSNTFATYAAFKTRVYRDHESLTKEASKSKFCNDGVKYVCGLVFCKQTCEGLVNFVSHIKSHVRQGTEINCPFVHCTKSFTKLPTFTAHLSRLHRDLSFDSVRAQYVGEMHEVLTFNPVGANSDIADPNVYVITQSTRIS